MRKVILDVDTGSDDAVAIMTALLCPDLEVVGICTVWGNMNVDLTTDNTLRLLDRLGKPVPVYKGCGTAMVKYLAPRCASNDYKPVFKDGKELKIHYDHLEGLEPTDWKEEDMDAVSFYVNKLRNTDEKLTLIPVGPLTNLGEALSIAPDIAENIEEIVLMGGGEDIANVTPCAEANIWHDPEAAQKVLDCGAKVTFIPLDATHSVALDLEDCKTLRSLGSFAGDFAATMTEQRIEYEHAAIGPGKISTAIHDALAVCAVIDRSILTDIAEAHVEIGLDGYNEGETIVDHAADPADINASFAKKADKKMFMDMLCRYLKEGK